MICSENRDATVIPAHTAIGQPTKSFGWDGGSWLCSFGPDSAPNRPHISEDGTGLVERMKDSRIKGFGNRRSKIWKNWKNPQLTV